MGRVRRIFAIALALVAPAAAFAQLGCVNPFAPRYEFGVEKQRFFAAEDGRALELVEVYIFDRKQSLSGVSDDFVEVSDGAAIPRATWRGLPANASGVLASWPTDGQVPETLLTWIRDHWPEYRRRFNLHLAADGVFNQTNLKDWNPGRRWVVGTRPLAVAFGPVPATPKPPGDAFKGSQREPRDLATSSHYGHGKGSRMVTTSEAAVGRATHVLLCHGPTGTVETLSADDMRRFVLRAKLFRLREPTPLRQVIALVAGGPTALASASVESSIVTARP